MRACVQEPCDNFDESRKAEIEEALSRFWENEENLKKLTSPVEHDDQHECS